MTGLLDQKIADLELAIAAQENLRPMLGNEVVDTTMTMLREKLAELVAQAAPPETRRKQVTVMFADIASYTQLSESLDAEDLSELLNEFWQHIDAIIIGQGGMIDKHIGDAVMAFWGAEISREDDAERAIRAALAMQTKVAAISQTPLKRYPNAPAVQMRIGIHTGPVVLGEMGLTAEYTAIGDTVNTAERIQKAAEPGSILISHQTFRHVRGIFNIRAKPPITVKGKQDQLQLYQILEAKPRAFRMGTRGIEDIDTPLVGRSAELDKLQQIFLASEQSSQAYAAVISGEAGIGKSRLLFELENWIDLLPRQIRLFKGRASPTTQYSPYALLQDIFSFRFQILDSDPPEIVYQKMLAGFTDVFKSAQVAEMHAGQVYRIFGLDAKDLPHPPTATIENDNSFGENLLGCLAEYFRAATEARPVILFLEDLHWADHSSLTTLANLLPMLKRHPLCIIATTRPSLFEGYPRWGTNDNDFTQISLQPLSKADSRRLVEEILQKVEKIPAILSETVVNMADGNPYAMEELVKMLIDEQVILKFDVLWRVDPARLVEIHIPSTLTGILQARLDSLHPEERGCLQRASVIGRIFWTDAVASLKQADSEFSRPETLEILRKLQSKEMIFQRLSSAFADDQEYIFKNIVLREVVYEGVLKRERRHFHAQVAEWLIKRSSERLGEFADLIAQHLELSEQTERAVLFLRKAGERALQISAYREALQFFDRAATLIHEDSAEKVWDHIQAARAQLYLGDYVDAQIRLEDTLDLARQLQDYKGTAAALDILGEIERECGDYQQAKLYLEDGLKLAEQADDHTRVARILIDLGLLDISHGAVLEARQRFEAGLSIYQRLEEQSGIAFALNRLGTAYMMSGDYTAAEVHLSKSLSITHTIGDRRGSAGALTNLGENARLQANYPAALSYYRQALEIFKAVNSQRGSAIIQTNLGHVSVILGDYTGAARYYADSLAIAQKIGLIPQVLDTLAGMAHLWGHTNKTERALELLGAIMQHPALMDETKVLIDSVLGDIKNQVDPTVIPVVMKRGSEMDFETLLAQIAQEK